MMECVTQTDEYIRLAQQTGSPAFCITNHGNVVGWMKRKEAADKAGLKYIHGLEAYATETIEEKLKDNYHITLLAKNWEGVKEINKLSSISFQGRGTDDDNHYYYKPRISFDEIAATSDNVIILTACLGSPIWQNYINGNRENLEKWINFFVVNKHRVYLEVQPHMHEEQLKYNKLLLALAKKHDMKIVATNDVHALNEEHDELRQVMKASKGIVYETDDEFELWVKGREAITESFLLQGVLTPEQIEQAIDATLEIADSVEEFELDRKIKYPAMYENPEQKFKEIIAHGYLERGLTKLDKETQQKYKDRVNKELAVYKKTESINYMLLEWTVKKWARERKIYPGYGRGSASGSLIAYLLRITEMDSIRHDLNFERFMNENRISTADIDSDWFSKDRVEVQKYLLNHPDLHCASIMTVNRYGLKGAIKAVGRGLGTYSSDELNMITKSLQEEDGEVIVPKYLYDEHPKLIDFARKIEGTVDSFGRHAAGVVVSSEPIDETIGLMTVAKWDHPVTQMNMKEIDALNFVKLDVLGLDNIKLINQTAEFADLGHLTPDSTDIIDFQDENVWKSMREDSVGIFQFESVRAGKILKELFSDETLEKIKKRNPDVQYIDLLSLANAAQRPAGASYLESLLEGKFKDNGHKALDEFLASTMGNLVYQEQQTAFLVRFCGWSESEADLIRRGIGKKDFAIMESEVPKIKPSFIKTMVEEYGDTEEHAESVADAFIQVFMDSVNYGFSINHSSAYSYIGYISAWLRYYYPLEFVVSGLEIWKDDQDKTNALISYAEKQGIELKTPKFRYSKGGYFFDRETDTVYQGTAPLKDNNAEVGNLLYELRDRKFSSFTDLLLNIRESTTITIEGEAHKLADIYENWSEEEVAQLDKDIKSLEPKEDYCPYTDKSLHKKFDKWLQEKAEPERLESVMQVGIEGDGYNHTDDGVKEHFDYWKDVVFKGKKKWLEEPEEVMDVQVARESLPINKTKIVSLIRMNFFSEFGGNKKLFEVFEKFNDSYKHNNKTYKGKQAKYLEIKELEESLEDSSYSVIEQCEFELYYTGRVTSKNESVPPRYAFVTEITNSGKTRTSAIVFIINKGVSTPIKVGAGVYRNVPFKEGDLIEVQKTDLKAKMQKIGGEWIKSETEKEIWVKQMRFIRRSSIENSKE